MQIFTLKSVTCFVISFGVVLSQSCIDTIPPLLCWTASRNTTGLHANTEYSIIRLADCSKQIFPAFNCTGIPGSPKNLNYNVSGYDFNLYWNASIGAGGERSVLKGFKVILGIEPCNGSPLPSVCFYVNITKTTSIQYVLGMFFFSCNYTQQGKVTVKISSYPTPEVCSIGVKVPNSTAKFFLPLEMESSVSTKMSTLQTTTTTPVPVKNIVILTSLTVIFVIILILITVTCICMWKRQCRAQSTQLHSTRQPSNTSIDSTHDSLTSMDTNVSSNLRLDENILSHCSQHSYNGMNENMPVNNIFYLPDNGSDIEFYNERIVEDLDTHEQGQHFPKFCRFRDTFQAFQSEWKDVHRERQLQVQESTSWYAFDNGNDSRHHDTQVHRENNFDTDTMCTGLNELEQREWKKFISRINYANMD